MTNDTRTHAPHEWFQALNKERTGIIHDEDICSRCGKQTKIEDMKKINCLPVKILPDGRWMIISE